MFRLYPYKNVCGGGGGGEQGAGKGLAMLKGGKKVLRHFQHKNLQF